VRQKQAANDFDPGVLGALTPAYSSMQVLGGEEPVAQDDVFSLGCLMYRLVAGYRVFGPRNAAEASQAGMTPQKPQGLSDGHWAALKKALSYPRVTRFKSVREFLDALGHYEEKADARDTTVIVEPPERFVTDDEGGSPGTWVAILVVLLGLGAIGAKQLGYLDPWIAGLTGETIEVAAPDVEPIVTESPSESLVEEQAPVVYEPVTSVAAQEPEEKDAAEDKAVEATPDEATPETPAPVVPREPLVDFSKLPPATVVVTIAADGSAPSTTPVVLPEDGDAVIVDFVRSGDLAAPLALRLEEIGFTGNTSPWANGQYALSNAGLLNFPIGQERARITIRPADDPRREPDQQSTLRLRPVDAADTELAIVNVTLEDDDRRAFENRLPANTLGFSQSQVSVNEADPAVQVDVMRFNPDESALVVEFSVEDLTATEGEDYFAPGSYTISFAPGQHTARLLIPLVQDSRAEGDEAFVVKLSVDPEKQPVNVTPNVAVMIRDDE
jgi:hypothetical protein